MRKEIDSLGELFLPDEVYYGIQTERARQNFDISGQTHHDIPKYIWSVTAIKKAAAMANMSIGVLEEKVGHAICKAADEVMEGKMEAQFPIDVFQGGGGTSTNMNVNEVLANRANEILTGKKGYDRVDPNTHVNMGQSTNDVIPAAMKITAYLNLEDLLTSMKILEMALKKKTSEFKHVVKIGRTCLQDAVPLTLGQEFSGYLSFLKRQIKKVKSVAEECLELPLGATAIGTELTTFPGYLEKVYPYMHEITGINVIKEKNFFDGLQNGDLYIDVSGALKSLAAGLSKMATDFRILSSGPRAGLNEITLPAIQPGSSIMPGKINPVMPELINQVCYRVYGNDLTIAMAVEGGELDLNVWEPVIIKSLFESCRLLTKAIPLFTEKCVLGIKANKQVCRKYAEASISLSTVIASLYGYKTGSAVAKRAYQENKSIKEVVIQMGLLSSEEAERLLDPALLTDPKRCAEAINESAKNIKGIK